MSTYNVVDKIDDLVGKNQISDSDGQEIKSKLMIGQSESVKSKVISIRYRLRYNLSCIGQNQGKSLLM